MAPFPPLPYLYAFFADRDYRDFARYRGTPVGDRSWDKFRNYHDDSHFQFRLYARRVQEVNRLRANLTNPAFRAVPFPTLTVPQEVIDPITMDPVPEGALVAVAITLDIPPLTLEGPVPDPSLHIEYQTPINLDADGASESLDMYIPRRTAHNVPGYDANNNTMLGAIPAGLGVFRLHYGAPAASFGRRRMRNFADFVQKYRAHRQCSFGYARAKYIRALRRFS